MTKVKCTMFGSMKKAMAVAAVVAVGAFAAPAVASASGTWTLDGNPIASPTAVEAHGSLTLIAAASPVEATCDFTFEMTLANSPANGHVQVDHASFANCVVRNAGPLCTMVVTATDAGSTLPWTGTGDASTQQISIDDLHFVNTFGPGCPPPLTNGSFPRDGSLLPTFDSGTQSLSFDGTASSGTITSPLGTDHVSGDLEVTSAGVLELS